LLYLWISYDSHCKTGIISLTSIYKLVFLIERCVFYEAHNEFLNIVYMSCGFKGCTNIFPFYAQDISLENIWEDQQKKLVLPSLES
jgi:hypothetical protein